MSGFRCGTCEQIGDILMRVADYVQSLPPEEAFLWRKQQYEDLCKRPYPHATMEEERAAGSGTYE